jgi:hypothetical protein
MLNTKIQTALIALVLVFQAFVPAAAADFLPVRAYGTDTVAGYASKLKTSMLTPGRELVFVVEKPDYSVVRIPAQADLEGVAVADLYGHQTKLAGSYKVAVTFPGSAQASPQNSFQVYADQVSETQSELNSTTQMVEADGVSKTFITVTLYDAYRNPISDHYVKLISSRKDDAISTINGSVTDENGRASFKVTSKYTGVSVYTAMDTTASTVLTDREEVVFYAPKTNTNGIGGNYFSTNMLQANVIGEAQAQEVLPGPVHSFDIEDLPSSVKVNTDQTMTVVARDKDGNVAKNYTGTILISTPDDENAVLPNNGEYTFKEADQGKFTFNLALRFTQLGEQYVQVLDKDNWKISGEKLVTVNPAQAITEPDTSESLRIKAPVDGGKFGSNTVVISGQGDPNINLKVFDNDVKIGDTETDSDGFFTYQAKNLSAGPHEFYVMSDGGKVSESVSVTVDTLPPVLNYLDILPDGVVLPGEALKVSLGSEPNLEEASIRIQGISKTLAESSSQPGTYTTTVAAPGNDGSYTVDVILVDSLSNRAELIGQKTIVVESPAPEAPPVVQNPEGEAGDGQVLLSWDAVTEHDTAINFYRIRYGTEFDDLSETLETADDSTAVTVSDLDNDTQYFFAVSAVDVQGSESQESSVTIAVTPVDPEAEDPDAEEPDESGDPSEDAEEDISDEDETMIEEPEDPADPLNPTAPGQLPPASLYNNPVQGNSVSNTVTLNWQPFPGVPASYYKIYFGLSSGQYDDYVITPDNRTTFPVRDLINGIPYYFAVAALDSQGNEISPLSAELTMIPSGTGFHAASQPQSTGSGHSFYQPGSAVNNDLLARVPAADETGPEAVWLILISLIGGYSLYRLFRGFRTAL